MEEGCAGVSMQQVGKQMEFLRLFKLLNSTLREHIDRNIKALELTTSQLDVLVSIAQHCGRPVSQREIEEELHLSNPTVTGILKRLERKGFITRTVGARDRRYREVRLTEKCARLAERLQPEGKLMLMRAFRGFTPEEFDTLNRMLERLLENCRQVREEQLCEARGGEEIFPAQAAPAACPSGCAR